jgi:hypothetical protein
MVTVSPVVVYSMRLELKNVYSVMDEVGLVDSGFMILAMTMVDVVLALNVLGMHPLSLNFVLDSTIIVQVLINVAADLNEDKAALTELLN